MNESPSRSPAPSPSAMGTASSPEFGQPGLPIIGHDCWNRIGIAGDRSCPELQTHIHCRNCPVFASAARDFFGRSAPTGYLTEWTQWLAGSTDLACGEADHDVIQGDRDLISVLIFRLGKEWLAFRTQAVAEVTAPRPVHRIPHRSSSILIGLVNLRGQLQLQVSLHGLLGVVNPAGSPTPSPSSSPGPVRETESGAESGSIGTPVSRLVVLR